MRLAHRRCNGGEFKPKSRFRRQMLQGRMSAFDPLRTFASVVGRVMTSAQRLLPIAFLIVFGFYLVLAIRIPMLFDFGIDPPFGGLLDGAVAISIFAIFALLAVSVLKTARRSRTVPWGLILALFGSFAVALVVEKWIVDPLPLNGFKAVGAYFYLATPAVSALGLLALWVERHSSRPRA